MNNVYDDPDFFSAYARMNRSQSGLAGAGEWHQFQAMFPDLHGKTVLDLGCGYGWHCKYAVTRGAERVLGIDMSVRMIREAEKKNADIKITYQVCDIHSFPYPANAYDCVISNLVLHYVEDLFCVYRRVYKTLKPDGVFLINIEHPVFTAGVREDWIYGADGKPLYWPIDRYFEPGERQTNFLGQEVNKQHHTLTQILMGLITAGFTLSVVQEATPSPEMMALPGMADELRRPMMLMIRAKKTDGIHNG